MADMKTDDYQSVRIILMKRISKTDRYNALIEVCCTTGDDYLHDLLADYLTLLDERIDDGDYRFLTPELLRAESELLDYCQQRACKPKRDDQTRRLAKTLPQIKALLANVAMSGSPKLVTDASRLLQVLSDAEDAGGLQFRVMPGSEKAA